jgi:hypothetical protein
MPITVNVRTGEVAGKWVVPRFQRQVRAAAPGPSDVTEETRTFLASLRPGHTTAPAPAPAYPAGWLPELKQQPHNQAPAPVQAEAQAPSVNGHKPDAPDDLEAYPLHWITGADGKIISGGGEGPIN